MLHSGIIVALSVSDNVRNRYKNVTKQKNLYTIVLTEK